MENVQYFFIIHESDKTVRICKLNVIDKEKCDIIIDIFTKISVTDKEKILNFLLIISIYL